jgi:hypothetical protein
MRWLMLAAVAAGCGTEDIPLDAAFMVTITNTDEACSELAQDMRGVWGSDDLAMADVCNCENTDGTDCEDDAGKRSESLTYDLFLDGDTVSIEVDGQPFASGSILGCELSYESPVWLDVVDGAKVNWQVRSVGVLADTTGACGELFPGSYHFLGLEEIEIVESDSVDYPVGRTVRKVIHGQRKNVEE